MPSTQIYNQQGKKLEEELDLEPGIFCVEPNRDLLAQYVRVYQHNQRQGTVKTKNRSDVSGGGKKPWPQKGTGRARHGSIRSPLWVGGGTVFGPQPKDWGKRLPKKMRTKALCSALSLKNEEGRLLVLDSINLEKPKTKNFKKMLNDITKSHDVSEGFKYLFVLEEKNDNVYLSARNLKNAAVVLAEQLNPFQILRADMVIMTTGSIKKIKERV